MYANIELYPGGPRTSPNGEYTLSMEESGRLLIRSSDGRVIWKTPASRSGESFAVVQPSGNLVIYAGNRFFPGSKQMKALWATNRWVSGSGCCAKILDTGPLAVLDGREHPSFAGPEDKATIIWQSPADPDR